MLRKLLLACAIILGASTKAIAEPVSISLALSAILGGAVIDVAFVAGALQIGLGLALTAGLALASGALIPKGLSGFGSGLNTSDVRLNERQAIPYKRIIYGTAQVGGALFFEQTKTPYLYQGLLICAEKISGFRKVFIGTNEVALTKFGDYITENTTLIPLGIIDGESILHTPDYENNLKLSLRKGESDQAIDSLLDTDFTSLSTDFRQRGIATAVLRYDYGANVEEFTELWGQVQRPNPILIVDGIAVYDPRDPTQDKTDQDTWKFSNNATLVQTHYLTHEYGGRIPLAKINWTKVANSADWDDGLVGCKDGTYIKRYTIDGVVTLNQPPNEVLKGLLSANRGRILESGGLIWPSSSRPVSAIATITDDILVGGIEFRASKPKKELVNRVKVRFIASEREYQTADGPILSREDLQEEDGEILDGTLDLPFTLDYRRAERLQKAFLDNARLGKSIVCRADISLYADCADELVGSAVNFESALFPQANGLYYVNSVGFAENYTAVELSLSEYDPDIEADWTPSVDETDFELEDLDVS